MVVYDSFNLSCGDDDASTFWSSDVADDCQFSLTIRFHILYNMAWSDHI